MIMLHIAVIKRWKMSIQFYIKALYAQARYPYDYYGKTGIVRGMNYFLLAVSWGSWCAMHSFLISTAVTGYLQSSFSGYHRWYRIFYNSFSLITLIPLVYSLNSFDQTVIFRWQDFWVILRVFLLVLAFVLFREGAKKYALGYFLGIKQLQTGKSNALLNDEEVFARTGAFGFIRHPWYAGSLLLVWSVSPAYSMATLVVSFILTVYLVTGTVLEERKIMAEHGEKYQAYQQHVSMLFPWKWLTHRLKR
jgi:protein-S-isoprenylcysteine O-methyltransferase Ste14